MLLPVTISFPAASFQRIAPSTTMPKRARNRQNSSPMRSCGAPSTPIPTQFDRRAIPGAPDRQFPPPGAICCRWHSRRVRAVGLGRERMAAIVEDICRGRGNDGRSSLFGQPRLRSWSERRPNSRVQGTRSSDRILHVPPDHIGTPHPSHRTTLLSRPGTPLIPQSSKIAPSSRRCRWPEQVPCSEMRRH